LASAGIAVERAFVFGSHARGCPRADSDIDVLVISPVFDGKEREAAVDTLWRVTWSVDTRIEPVAAGVRQYEEEAWTPLLMEARRCAVMVYPAETASVRVAAENATPYRRTSAAS